MLNKQQIQQILDLRNGEDFKLKNIPSPSLFKDMDKATRRILSAIINGEFILLVGDYDVDGATSIALFSKFLNSIQYNNYSWVIPNRFKHGYGISKKLIEEQDLENIDLIITFDNGISIAQDCIDLINENNIDLIITDHHTPLLNEDGEERVLEDVFSVINPHQKSCSFPFKEICGCQVAFFLVASLKMQGNYNINLMDYLALSSVAIIGDMMKIVNLNKAWVKKGLSLIEKSKEPWAKAFMEKMNSDTLDEQDIGFNLAPMVNSAGRLDDAKYAVEYFNSLDIYDARKNLDKLDNFNKERKEIENKMTDVLKEKAKDYLNDDVLVLEANDNEDFHQGVVGISCARISRQFNKATIILSNLEDEYKGSGRSFNQNIDLYKMVFENKHLLEKFGGHKSACGLSLKKEDLEAFRLGMNKSFDENKMSNEFIDEDIIGEIDLKTVDFELLHLINSYKPYGFGNASPKFTSKVIIDEVQVMGKDGLTRKIHFKNTDLKGVMFKVDSNRVFNEGKAEIIFSINENVWNGNSTLQIMIEDVDCEQVDVSFEANSWDEIPF